MIVKTRYRDIPEEEIISLGIPIRDVNWKDLRGTETHIIVPAVDPEVPRVNHPGCDGPIFFTYPIQYVDGYRVAVCPHIVDIGD